jgi:hypothetical protein
MEECGVHKFGRLISTPSSHRSDDMKRLVFDQFKSIYEKESIFNKLESKFYNIAKKLSELDPHTKQYHELFNEKDKILKEIDMLLWG